VNPRQGWIVVAASALGIAISPGTIVFYTLGVLMGPIAEATHWDRSAIAFAASVFTFVLIFAIPAVGALIDRYGVRRVLIPSQVLFGATLIGISLCGTVGQLYIAFAALAAFGAGANSVSYMRAVCGWFDRRRGLAIGLAQSGMGLGLMLMPLATNALLEHGDWKFAYAALGLLVLVIAVPVVFLFVRENPGASRTPSSAQAEAAGPGVSVPIAIGQRNFWALLIGFFALAGAINSTALHLVPMIEANGTSRQFALTAASAFGAAMLIGRLATGLLVDRFFAPAVAATIFASSSVAIALLALGVSVPLSIAAAFVVGISAGSDGDLLSYLVSRYFGLCSFATLSGYIFSAYLLGTSLFPWLVGVVSERTGTYSGVMLFCAVLGVGAAASMLTLGTYARAAGSLVREPV
jgi:MFS family permease